VSEAEDHANQVLDLERLGQEVVHARLQGGFLFGLEHPGAQRHDGQVRQGGVLRMVRAAA
jgi:hypothetical protein